LVQNLLFDKVSQIFISKMSSREEKNKHDENARLECCLSSINEGNDAFKCDEFLLAAQLYTNALKMNCCHVSQFYYTIIILDSNL
jgi:hypothetical protein